MTKSRKRRRRKPSFSCVNPCAIFLFFCSLTRTPRTSTRTKETRETVAAVRENREALIFKASRFGTSGDIGFARKGSNINGLQAAKQQYLPKRHDKIDNKLCRK